MDASAGSGTHEHTHGDGHGGTPDPSAERTPRIVVGVDGSPAAIEALRWARDVAELENAALDVVAVYGLPPNFGWAYAPPFDFRNETRKALADTVRAVFGSELPTGLRTIVAEGDAAHELLRRSKAALMVVVGSRGHGGFPGLYLGSVSAKVAELASCPVLVVHPSATGGARAA